MSTVELTVFASVLTQPRQLQAIFKDSDKHRKAPANNSGWYMDQLLGKCVGLISGRAWRSVRTVAEVPFTHQAVSQLVPLVERHVDEHFKYLHTTSDMDRGLIHAAQDTKMLPFWVVSEVFYGRLPPDLHRELSDLVPLRERVFQHVIYGGLPRFAWSGWLLTAANAQLREFKQRWRAFNQQVIEHARKDIAKAPIVSMYEATVSGMLSEEQLLHTLDESLYANLDVTTGGLSWNLVFLAAHPHVQTRLRNEVEEAHRLGVLRTYLLSRDTHLAACVLESSRLKPLAAFSVPQAAPTAREVDGYIVPANTSFIVDAYALNIRNEAWAPDNTAFRPDRFLGKREGDRRYLFWRFGFGPRQCMGKYLADLIIRTTLAHLVLNYELSLIDDGVWKRSRESWITHPDVQLQCVKRM